MSLGRQAAEVRVGYLGLGSNIGARRTYLQEAIDTLRTHGVTVARCSSTYTTEPVGLILEQPDFLNACIEVRTALEPLGLLDVCKAVEREIGRAQGGPRHGPRVIDVDVLLLGELRFHSERLTLPHEQVSSRRFVLVPLLELAPELCLPTGEPLSELLALLGDAQAVRPSGPPLSI